MAVDKIDQLEIGSTKYDIDLPPDAEVSIKSVNASSSIKVNGTDVLTSHQSIKTLDTTATSAQSTSASETITGTGKIILHKVSKTGNYNDLLNKPTIPTNTNQKVKAKNSGTDVTFGDNDVVEIKAGTNVQVAANATDKTITISSTDTNTTYTVASGDGSGQIKITPSSGNAYNVDVKGLGSAAYKSTGTASGNVPVLDSNGKLVESIIPAVAITDTYEASSQAAMLALSAQKGDICIRSDLNKCFVLQTTPASELANWKELKTPTDAVLSVNGKTGTITLDYSDVGALASNGTAANSSKLNNQEASYYLNYNNLNNKPTIDNNNQTVKGNGTAFGANAVVNIVGGGATSVAADTTNNKITISSSDTGATSIETTGTGNVVSSASYDSSTRKITLTKGVTALTSHQSIKTLKTDNTTAQTASSSEALNGSGTINLHKIAKTGNYNDLLNKPTIPTFNSLNYIASISSNNTSTYKWHRLMHLNTMAGFADCESTFYYTARYQNGPHCIFRVEFRTNNTSGPSSPSIRILSGNMPASDMVICMNYTKRSSDNVYEAYCDAFVKVPQWARAQLYRIGDTTSSNIVFYNSSEADGAASHVEAYTEINGSTAGCASYDLYQKSAYDSTGSTITQSYPASDVSSWAKASTKPTYTASEVGALPDTTKYAASSSVGGPATSAAKLTNTTKIGDTNKPVYFTANGVPEAISYTISKSVPSDAVFTDTQSDWNVTDSTNKAFIKNKPSIPTNTNQTIKVGSTTFGANDVVGLVAGTNIDSITADASAKTITINAKDTTYSSKAAASGGTDVSLVTTGEKYTWNNKSDLTIGTTSTTAAAGNHAHGNITNSGTITSTAVTSATGVLVYDSSNKIQRATNANARAIIGAGTYSKPDGGIPAEDLAEEYLPLTGGSVTGELKLYTASGDSPRLTFQRGTLTDTYNDWSLYDTAGHLHIQQRGSSSSAWETRAKFTQQGVEFGGTISEGGTLLSNKYLGKSAKAADSDKLDGNDSTYYLNYNNLTNTPTLGTQANYSYNSSTGTLTITTL